MIPVVILAGGKGTRLRGVIGDKIPKPMANISGKPFLWWLLSYLEKQGVDQVYLSVGYKKEEIIDYFHNNFGPIRIDYLTEKEPLGTGGAIKNACKLIAPEFLVMNGDTFSEIDIKKFLNVSRQFNADISIALADPQDSERYGTIQLDPALNITSFAEKKNKESGFVNAGIYYIKAKIAPFFPKETSFSFENDFIEMNINLIIIKGIKSVSNFIDIGIPDDFHRAQEKIPVMCSQRRPIFIASEIYK